jgi:hypothetical protein
VLGRLGIWLTLLFGGLGGLWASDSLKDFAPYASSIRSVSVILIVISCLVLVAEIGAWFQRHRGPPGASSTPQGDAHSSHNAAGGSEGVASLERTPPTEPAQPTPEPISVSTLQPSAVVAASPANRVMCALSPKRLVELYCLGATDVQGDSQVAQYEGQWREISGTVREVKRLSRLVISVDCTDSDQVHLSLFFDPNAWAAHVHGLMPSDPIKAVGQVIGVSPSSVILDNCELV